MHKILTFLLLVVPVCTAQPQPSVGISPGALVDFFPLAVGNSWEYGYSWGYDTGGPPGTGSHTDTGTVTMEVVGRADYPDSTVWILKETSCLWTRYDLGSFEGPVTSVDTIHLVEVLTGYHKLYNSSGASKAQQSVFPFPTEADTVVCRYDSLGAPMEKTIHSRSLLATSAMTFKQGIGLTAIIVDDGCTCIGGFAGTHSLRNQMISSVPLRDGDGVPQECRLLSNYPNPFNPSTIIPFSVPSRSFIVLRIYDCIGREVATLVDSELAPGMYSVAWYASAFPSGIYYCRLQSGSFTQTMKLMLVK